MLQLLVLPLLSNIASSINTTTVTTITTMPKDIKVKFSKDFEGEDELSQNKPSVCRLSKGCNCNILGTVWRMQL